MMLNHSNVLIQMRAKAPVIILSETGNLKTGNELLIVDLGHMYLHTEKLAKAAYEKSLAENENDNDRGSPTGGTSDATFPTMGLGGTISYFYIV